MNTISSFSSGPSFYITLRLLSSAGAGPLKRFLFRDHTEKKLRMSPQSSQLQEKVVPDIGSFGSFDRACVWRRQEIGPSLPKSLHTSPEERERTTVKLLSKFGISTSLLS